MSRELFLPTGDPNDAAVDAALRSLDPADRDVTVPPVPSFASGGAAPTPLRARRRVGRLVLAAAAVVAVAGSVVAAPALTRGDAAFATWEPVPTGLSAGEARDAADQCREAQGVDGGRAVVAERRGAWTTVVIASAQPGATSALCVTDESRPFFRSWIGSSGPAVDEPGPREVVVTDLGTGSIDGADISLAAGRVGSDVVSVALGDVEATVHDGWFALWEPGAALTDAPRDGVQLRVGLADGSSDLVTVRLD
ncbi:hypothetical protein [Nocardioides flavescens]|uniref:Uncharacterized protein n=1 Tax=Nocardioides flavescens TaxID=2691959 RepID=A0A6L7F0R6_9ACTN|nr:hypothetical protein [Nocardioides flavescens]MXG89722.1 hypothetical protein [Nocardioides flavescens]